MTQQQPLASITEEQIQQAYAAGQFVNLPGLGQPIPDIDEEQDEDWWINQKLRREKISILPPSLEILRDVEKTLAQAMTLGTERAVRREIEALNVRIRDANLRSFWGPPSTQMPLVVDDVVARWRAQPRSR